MTEYTVQPAAVDILTLFMWLDVSMQLSVGRTALRYLQMVYEEAYQNGCYSEF